MATILKIDETSGLDATTQDTAGALPTLLTTSLNTITGGTSWQSLIKEKAEATSISVALTADTLDIQTSNEGRRGGRVHRYSRGLTSTAHTTVD